MEFDGRITTLRQLHPGAYVAPDSGVGTTIKLGNPRHTSNVEIGDTLVGARSVFSAGVKLEEYRDPKTRIGYVSIIDIDRSSGTLELDRPWSSLDDGQGSTGDAIHLALILDERKVNNV
ncbi:MAG TPA: hypothetical protein VGD26_03405 [Chitinophagaceae bacterium]